MSTASMILGICGVVFSCTCCMGSAASALAVILGLLSRTGERMEFGAKAGVIAGAAGLFLSAVFGTIWIIFLTGV